MRTKVIFFSNKKIFLTFLLVFLYFFLSEHFRIKRNMHITNIFYAYFEYFLYLCEIYLFKMRMSFNFQNYQFTIGEHNSKNVIFVHFPYNLQWKNELKAKFPTAK